MNQDYLTHSLFFCQTGPAGCNYFFPACSWDAFGMSHGLKVTSAAGCSRGAHRQLPIHLHILVHVQQCSQKFLLQQPSGVELLSFKNIYNRARSPQMGSAPCAIGKYHAGSIHCRSSAWGSASEGTDSSFYSILLKWLFY